MNNNLSLLKVISGLSKTINVANQMLPLYKQVKPILSSANKMLSTINNFSLPKKETTNYRETKNNEDNSKQKSINTPTFFQ